MKAEIRSVPVAFQLAPEILGLARQQAEANGMPIELYLKHVVTATVTGRDAQMRRAHEAWEQSRAIA